MGEENKRLKEIPVKQRIKEEGVILVKQLHMHIDDIQKEYAHYSKEPTLFTIE